MTFGVLSVSVYIHNIYIYILWAPNMKVGYTKFSLKHIQSIELRHLHFKHLQLIKRLNDKKIRNAVKGFNAK